MAYEMYSTNNASHTSVATTTAELEVHVFKYRWVILLIFGMVSIVNFMQMLQFSIISNILSKFYDVESFWIDLTTIIFFVCYILFFYPVSYLIKKFNLKITVITATNLTLLGNILKLFAASPDRLWLVIVAQFFIAVGQVQLCSLPSKLATTWFGGEEVSTACAIVVLGMQLGTALGCVQSPFIVRNGDTDSVSAQLYEMFLYQAILTGSIFLLVILGFRSRPRLPPSRSQLDLINDFSDFSFLENMQTICLNKNFWFIVMSLGLANGVWNSFGVLVNNLYLNYFPKGESDAGLIALITIVSGGCIGSMVFGVLLDKTHHFKRTTFGILAASAISFIFVALSLIYKSKVATFIAIPIFGFFVAPVLIVGFEYLVEVTYPIPEECSSALFNAAYFLLSIAATLVFEELFTLLGYNWTFVVIFVILSISAVFSLLIDSQLKRRDANLRALSNNR